MNRSFENYYQEYLKKYNKLPLGKIDIKKEKQNTKFLLLIPFIFILLLNVVFIIYPNNNSKDINLLYSEKFINEDSYTNPKKIIDIYINDTETFVKNIEKFDNNQFDIISENRIKQVSAEKTLPPNQFDWKKGYSKKKIDFIETLLPLITYQNQQIQIERNRLFLINEKLKAEKTLKKDDILYLKSLAKKYYIKSNNKHKIDLVQELLKSVDIIPNSIVLAQAANESGWGSSRFAKEYNALFGQYTYDEKKGVIPYKREAGKKHLIKYFNSIDQSVESYFKNINTHHAYKKFRNLRNLMSKSNLDIKTLTQALDVYAEDADYVDTIYSIIKSNNFIQFDSLNSIFTSS